MASLNNIFKSISLSFVILLLTFYFANSIYKEEEENQNDKFTLECREIAAKLTSRLHAHAQLLRQGASFFYASDTVTREEWQKFITSSMLGRNLPGIQGVGFSYIIPKNQLKSHIKHIRTEGFGTYTVRPEGEREIYTSIIYLEPFKDRNLRAFGYDMFSEPVRHEAMQKACDYNIAALSGKVILVQETDKDIQAGTLMYVPVYKSGFDTSTIENKRKALLGWVYSPYRMNDLMAGVLGEWDLQNSHRIHLEVFDDSLITDYNLLYDSQKNDTLELTKFKERKIMLPVKFNQKNWILRFSQKSQILPFYQQKDFIIGFTGTIISLLIGFLLYMLLNSRKQLKHIQKLNELLQKQDSDKDRFISILAHDLKNPFNAILGFLNLLKNNFKKYEQEKIEYQLKIIENSARGLFNLLEELLLWARAQTNKIEFTPVYLNINLIFNEVIEITRPLTIIKNIRIITNADTAETIYADAVMLKTVIRNLLTNAIKYSFKDSDIMLEAVKNQNEIIVSITDNGTGMEPENLKKLFDISQKFTSPGTANETGTGLGLLICKEFINKHNGKIWAESQLGKGSKFSFALPITLNAKNK